jgi:hypothetical protein
MPKKSSTQKSAAQYKKMYKELKPYINFPLDLRKPLTRGQKTVITKYFTELQRLTNNKPYDVQIYRSKNKNKLKKVQELGGQDTHLTKFKVAFVPKTSPQQKIRFNKSGEAYTKGVYVKATFIPLDAEILATDSAIDYVNSVIEKRSENSFSIQAGDYEINGTFSKNRVASEVNKLCMRYSNQDSNNYFGNWLGGLFANEFENQSDLDSYRESKRNAQIKRDRNARKRENRNRIKVFYWFDRNADSVLVTKTEIAPNKFCEAITKREYERFLITGEL